uniref:Dynein regulatory complex protein 1 n=1 Tax=Trichobilharzia regenti TaxID=157069 RepID=A0AA85J462_TRIRE|nr:unnamed protein product [Trichobilharzia regenti]
MTMNKYTKKIYFKKEEIKDVGPSVDSDDIEQRIAARRLRIKNRQEMLGADTLTTTTKEQSHQVGLGRAQIEQSNQRIAKLIRDGDSFVTNIRVACDARENLKRAEDHELNQIRVQNLEDDATNSLDLFNKITEQWDIVQESELVDETRELLEKQKKLCTDLITEKNKLINELNLEVKAKDDHYVRELKKRTEDIDLLAERMESQIKAMQRAYREEILAIENAFLEQREKLTNEQNTEWEMLMKEIKQKQINYLKQHEEQVFEFEKELNDLRTKYSEEYNALKISLGSEVETLESHLQKLKSTYQLNLEKLEYNFQVLKRRDEENTVIKSNQKRKITRLQDNLNNLHIKSVKQEKQYSAENEQLTEDYKKRMENYRDLQKKAKLFLDNDRKNFHDIWIMNEETLKKSANRLLDAYRIITEQQLGLTWNPPDTTFMCNTGPLVGSLDQIVCKPPAVVAMELALQTDRRRIHSPQDHTVENAVPTSLKEVSPEIVKEFLQLLCYEPEFLIEEKMKRLLKPLGQEEELLLRLDTILTVLGVQTEEDLDDLFTYFIKQNKYVSWKNRPIHGRQQQHQQLVHSDDKSHSRYAPSTMTEESTQLLPTSSSKLDSTHSSRDSSNEANETVSSGQGRHSFKIELTNGHLDDEITHYSKISGPSVCHESIESKSDLTHHGSEESVLDPVNKTVQSSWSLISPVNVVDAIHQFTEDMRRRELQGGARYTGTRIRPEYTAGSDPITVKGKLCSNINDIKKESSHFNEIDHEQRNDKYDTEYWKKYEENIVDKETEGIWDNLYVAMERYYTILKNRAKLIRDTESLRRQNIELRHLLQQYMNSKVNYELQIPPSKTMEII